MADVGADVHEQILVRMDVEDLIRCKSVCKSWRSLISDHRFVKSHLKHTSNKDSSNTRILATASSFCYAFRERYADFDCCIVGSSNGLVCISRDPKTEIFVVNPLTRILKKLTTPRIPPDLVGPLFVCWGFGFDSSTDDYKVVLGFRKSFQVLSLKSNVWKVIGEIKYEFISHIGTLCNGALHWLMHDQYNNIVIVSFDLSTEVFIEIPQPNDARYVLSHHLTCLGTINDSLCIFQNTTSSSSSFDIWAMKTYNAQQSWQLLPNVFKTDNVFAKHLVDYVPPRNSFGHAHIWLSTNWGNIVAPVFVQSIVSPKGNVHIWLSRTRENLRAPVFVQSLVSPYGNGRLKRNRQAGAAIDEQQQQQQQRTS